MDKKEKEIRDLENLIRSHEKFYYIENNPKISDKEFDLLIKKLRKLEEKYPQFASEDSPTKTVGSDLSNKFEKISHKIPVLSLENTYNANELMEWVEKTNPEGLYSVEWKIDGASIVLYYENGILEKAVTRGSGGIGDDVTENILTIKTVPPKIKSGISVYVRGEVYMSFSDFAEFNQEYGGKFANPRNLAAGSLKTKYASEAEERPLNVFFYDAYFPNPKNQLGTHKEILEFLRKEKLPVPPSIQIVPGKKIPKILEEMNELKNKLDFPTDGLVIKLDSIAERNSLGETSHSPRWARAYKFDAVQKSSIIEEITIAIGRTGKVTPRAKIKPVSLAGTTVSFATLHNLDYIQELGVGIGAEVLVSKRGEIIPAVEKVITPPKKVFQFPKKCPACGTKLAKVDESVDWFCTNNSCPERMENLLIFFCQKKQMNIEGLGDRQIQFFFEKKWILDIPDIYKLHERKKELLEMEGFGELSVKQLLAGIEDSKKNPFSKVLPSLGLNEVGHKVTEVLIDSGIDSIDKLIQIAKEKNEAELSAIHGIGPRTIQAILEQLTDSIILSRIEKLKSFGLQFEETNKKVIKKDGAFANQSWCVTGSFENFQPREKALEIIVQNGGTKVSSVSSKTTHLLYGEGAGSKLEKGKELGVNLVDEKEFLKILKQAGI